MRVIDTNTGQFVGIDPEARYSWGENKRRYAILSHTWDKKGEQTYKQLKKIQERYTSASSANVTSAPSEHPRDGPPPEKSPLRLLSDPPGVQNPQQSVPCVPEGGASTGEQTTSGASPAPLLSEQPPSTGPPATAPLIPQSTRSKSGFTRRMARLKTWIQLRSSRNAPHSRAGSPSTSASPLTNHGRQSSLDHGQGMHSRIPPTSQLPDDSEPSEVTPRPPAAIGRLSASEVEGLFRTFAATYDLMSRTPAAIPNDNSAPCPGGQPPPSQPRSDSLSETPHPQQAIGHLTLAEVEGLLSAVANRYGLKIPAPTASYFPTSGPDSQSKQPPQTIWDDPELSPKIRDACRVARENGFLLIWIDSCCIDKSSSSELSEAINSMYKWYSLAKQCYAYLADVPPRKDHHAEDSAFRKSRWFTRGWTLQELVAPWNVEFLSQDWAPIGSKRDLVRLVKEVTNIDSDALLHFEPLDAFSVAQRLSWAATRETTRVEDRAYSLLGIFNINMPTLYGEGDSAFRRLQEQIMQLIPDHSLFAWGDIYPPSLLSQNHDLIAIPESLHIEARAYEDANLFAVSPDAFEGCNHIGIPQSNTVQLPHLEQMEYTFTPHGIRTQFSMIPLTQDLLLHALPYVQDIELRISEDYPWYLVILGSEHADLNGHLLGRVCYISHSTSGIQFLHPGFIRVKLKPEGEVLFTPPDLLPLSPKTIQYCHEQIETKTVYIPHPNRATHEASLSNRRQPYTAIKLVLLRKTRNALRSRGYSANLRDLDPYHPTTHWLTLSNDKHTITVEFRHSLADNGTRFTIEAMVKMSVTHGQSNSALESEQADGHTVHWSDINLRGWMNTLGFERVELDVADARTLTVDLRLDFLGHGYYLLHVDVLSEELLVSSAAEPAGDVGEEGERSNAEDVMSGKSAIQVDIGQAEAMGGEMASMEAKDAQGAGDDAVMQG